MIRLRLPTCSAPLSGLLSLCLLGGCGDDQVKTDDVGDTETTTDTTDETTETTAPEPYCGDGHIDPGEECDDGNDVEGDGCSAECTVTACGLVWRQKIDIDNINSRDADAALTENGDVIAVGVSVEDSRVIRVTRDNADGEVWRRTFDSQNGDDYGRGVALGPDGSVYVIGSMEQDGDAIWFARLDPDDGSEIWSRTVEGMVAGADDDGTGLTISAGGNLLVVGELFVADGDSDVWLSEVSIDDGSEIWSTTWSGMGDGNYSTDRAGTVTVAEDGSIWVGAREHVDFDSQEAVALRFGDDGSFLGLTQPQASGNHTHDPVDIVAGAGGVFFVMEKRGTQPYNWLVRMDLGGQIEWTKASEDWKTIGDQWFVSHVDMASADLLNVAGTYTNEEIGEQLFWNEAWIARIDADGEYVCRSNHMEGKGDFLPPSLTIDGAGSNSSGAMGMAGLIEAAQGPQVWLWHGYFSE